MINKSHVAILAAITAMAAGAADATVSIGPFTASGPGTTAVVSPTANSAVFTYSDHSFGPDTFTITATATHTGPVTFNYDSTGFYSFFYVSASADAFSNGAVTGLYSTGPANCCSPPSNGFDYTGSVTLDLVAGQTYGFDLTGSNFDAAQTIQGTFTVSAVSPAPEPAAWAMMLLGFAVVGGVSRARKARAIAA